MAKLRHILATAAVSGALLATSTDASAQFGRNKVQYEPRVFQIIRTEHFDVYFYEEEREAVSLRMNLFFAILRVDYAVPHDRGRAFNDGMWTVAFGEMF